mmetsp:Transcript_74867/g.195157  ORF Transcript_74867/g.195157 Transcript_74867/m.195157 type:complete len:207 (+) Transcript_74867:213-833(+)
MLGCALKSARRWSLVSRGSVTCSIRRTTSSSTITRCRSGPGTSSKPFVSRTPPLTAGRAQPSFPRHPSTAACRAGWVLFSIFSATARLAAETSSGTFRWPGSCRDLQTCRCMQRASAETPAAAAKPRSSRSAGGASAARACAEPSTEEPASFMALLTLMPPHASANSSAAPRPPPTNSAAKQPQASRQPSSSEGSCTPRSEEARSR